MHDQLFEQIKMDHNEVKKTLSQMLEAGSAKQRIDLRRQLEKLLIPHMRAEESVFYPELKIHRESRSFTFEALEEHHVTELVFDELMKLRPENENWTAKVNVLQTLLVHHIQDEEEQAFKMTRDLIPENKTDDMLADFAEEKIWYTSRITGEL